ncbi:PatA/PatG family cyanobactin maturation protease [Calothrix sp. FACHB-156]|nr:PatA/PatG family cyanobactin maturation protease [Calothrix sp. FACHB-156]
MLEDILKLHLRTLGSPEICVAILDGVVDQSHDCFNGADLTRLSSLVQGKASLDSNMSIHGTHVASIIFGQPGSTVLGIAPRCRGVIIPVFSDQRRSASQLDLARGIEQAINAGAHIINISGGQLTDFGEAEGWLENAVRLCEEQNVLLICAAGNDGCECLHVPAALPAVLAVGAMDATGIPMEFSNWGEAYQSQGIVALGENILGAKPGGGTQFLNGTSFATPVVSGVAALLLSLQQDLGESPDPQRIRQVLLQSALPCNVDIPEGAKRCLVGKLNVTGAMNLLAGGKMTNELRTTNGVTASGCGCGGALNEDLSGRDSLLIATVSENVAEAADISLQNKSVSVAPQKSSFVQPSQSIAMSNPSTNLVTPSQAPSELADKQLVYAIGTLGYDFGSEARRDSFKQVMEPSPGTIPNPYDARQMVDHLAETISEARSLIWTLNIELNPVYAIEPKGPFGHEVYERLRDMLAGQVLLQDDRNYIERVSIPGILTGKTVKLFSGQVVPVVEIQSPRGLAGWDTNGLIPAAMEAIQSLELPSERQPPSESSIAEALESFLNRVYYDLRNLGTTSQDRALNYSVTNIIYAVRVFARALADGREFDSVSVEKSPLCRLDSDCWDVKLKFFDPENDRRAKQIYRLTVDVSDVMPVLLGDVKTWNQAF